MHDPDISFYQDISSLETHYCSPNDFKNNFQSFLKDSFSVLHLNIRSMNKNFESFKEFYLKIKFKFSIFCFSETWVDAYLSAKVRIFSFQIIRSYIKQEKIVREKEFVFVHESLSFKLREDLSINCDAIQSLSLSRSLSLSLSLSLSRSLSLSLSPSLSLSLY